MADFRIKYGLALGPYGSIGSTSGGAGSYNIGNQFLDGDTTPDVTLGSYFLTGNTAATAITYFDGTLNTGVAGLEEGKVIVINFRDNNTVIDNAGQIFLSASGGAFATNETLALIHSNSAWLEIFRSKNVQDNANVLPEAFPPKFITVVVAASHAIDVTTCNLVFWQPSAANSVLQSLSGGEIGQIVTIVRDSSTLSVIRISDVGNLILGGSNSITAEENTAYQFLFMGSTNADASQWTLISSRARAQVAV